MPVIETIVEIIEEQGEHLNFNASLGARVRTKSYDNFSGGMRIKHNRNGSVSTTFSGRCEIVVRCDDGQIYNLSMREIVCKKRLTPKIRNGIIWSAEEYLPGLPLVLDNKGAVDYEALRKSIKERKEMVSTD